MAKKIQVLYSLKKEGQVDNPETLATQMGRALKAKSDKIPPAYPCEGQTLVFFVTEYFGKPEKKLMEFCKEIVPRRAANVALVVVGKDDSGNIPELEALFAQNGVNVAAKCGIAVKKSLFGSGKVTEEDIKKAVAFAEKTAEEA
jgi:hypothetical protein